MDVLDAVPIEHLASSLKTRLESCLRDGQYVELNSRVHAS